MTVKKFKLITQARKQCKGWERCRFGTYIRTFWYLVSNKFHNYSVFTDLWRLWGAWLWKNTKYMENNWFSKDSIIFKSLKKGESYLAGQSRQIISYSAGPLNPPIYILVCSFAPPGPSDHISSIRRCNNHIRQLSFFDKELRGSQIATKVSFKWFKIVEVSKSTILYKILLFSLGLC